MIRKIVSGQFAIIHESGFLIDVPGEPRHENSTYPNLIEKHPSMQLPEHLKPDGWNGVSRSIGITKPQNITAKNPHHVWIEHSDFRIRIPFARLFNHSVLVKWTRNRNHHGFRIVREFPL